MCIFQLAANSSRLTRPRARRYQGGASPPGTRARRRRPWRRGSACPPAPPRPRPSPRLPRRWWPRASPPRSTLPRWRGCPRRTAASRTRPWGRSRRPFSLSGSGRGNRGGGARRCRRRRGRGGGGPPTPPPALPPRGGAAPPPRRPGGGAWGREETRPRLGGGVRPVGRPERVVHVEVAQGGERLGKAGVVRLFARPEAGVLDQCHTAAREAAAGRDTARRIGDELDGRSQDALDVAQNLLE